MRISRQLEHPRSLAAPCVITHAVCRHPWQVYAEGKLSVRFDGEAEPTLSADVDLGAAGAIDSSGRAWVGFTASTGISSIDADLLSFAFCQYPACDAA